MVNEKITDKTTSYSVNIAGGKVESLRVNEDLKTVIRAYDGGNVGIAGKIGECDEAELLKEAKENLAQNIAYPEEFQKPLKRHVNVCKEIIPAEKFVSRIKRLVERLSKTYPDFIFSNKINMTEEEIAYTNSLGTDFLHVSNLLEFAIVIKAKNSANIMDLDYCLAQTYFDEDKIVSDIGVLLGAYGTFCELPENAPVIINQSVISMFLTHMVAEMYQSGASLLNGKLGTEIFNKKFNMYSDRTPGNRQTVPFFDSEGTVVDGDKFYFVKDGVFTGLATYKRSAKNFNLPLSGGGYSEFDAVPMASFVGVTAGETAQKVSDIVKGKAIYVSCTSGGDMTPDGTLGIPVQLAYLYEDGKLLGKLPEFSLTASVFDVLGKDFAGIALNDVFKYNDEKVIVSKFQINKG